MQNSFLLNKERGNNEDIFSTIQEFRFILKKQDNFWILSLRTLYPDGLNQELDEE